MKCSGICPDTEFLSASRAGSSDSHLSYRLALCSHPSIFHKGSQWQLPHSDHTWCMIRFMRVASKIQDLRYWICGEGGVETFVDKSKADENLDIYLFEEAAIFLCYGWSENPMLYGSDSWLMYGGACCLSKSRKMLIGCSWKSDKR